MPIYEFQCQNCRHEFENIQSFSDSSTPTCPQCQSESVQRRVSRPSIHFKGSGWYITDSKKDSKKDLKKAGSDKKKGEKTSETGDSKANTADSTEKSSTAEATTTQSSETTSKPSSEKSTKSSET